ncbi:hypothetical protein ACFWG5_34875 [Streptomyces hydrogenans]|uniref:hypothetical protein n=1 Tax=Streptomyces TaxID=1883 RepID=UPI00362B3B2B
MYLHTVDRSKDRPDRRVLLHRSFYLNETPRLALRCRLRGHRPVVDGHDSQYGNRDRPRWVVCDRCGVRPDPQGHLDPDLWNVGQPYTGPFNPIQPMSPIVRKQLLARGFDEGIRLPGAWPEKSTGTLSAELVIGRSRAAGINLTIGSAGAEHPLSGRIGLGLLGALYLSTERHGAGIQRCLNPTGYQNRTLSFDVHNGRAWWRVWAREDESRSTDPKWMDGSVNINPAHYLLGARTSEIINETCATGTVRLPGDTTHDVQLRLEERRHGRPRGRKRTVWMLDWDCPAGIPIRNDSWKGDNVYGGAFRFPTENVEAEDWAEAACTLIAESCLQDRERYGYRAA